MKLFPLVCFGWANAPMCVRNAIGHFVQMINKCCLPLMNKVSSLTYYWKRKRGTKPEKEVKEVGVQAHVCVTRGHGGQ
jgi:hypothetical protein